MQALQTSGFYIAVSGAMVSCKGQKWFESKIRSHIEKDRE